MPWSLATDRPQARRTAAATTLTLLFALGCANGGPGMADSSMRDGARPDSALPGDASVPDGSTLDGSLPDGTPPGDATPPDGGAPDSTPPGDASVGPRTCATPDVTDTAGTDGWDDTLGRATVTIDGRDACRRSYTLRSTATLRDSRPDNPRTVPELEGWPTLRSGHDLFDALHALALEEVRENSVEAIRDGAFNDGSPVACGTGGCFETGLLWNYVWTRDTAYAVDLGLAAMDPTRARNSLEFKLSERRGGGGLQIVQDTGSGGSYPVSSDRVAWAVGAWALLGHLEGAERDDFRDRAYLALENTIDHDRGIVFDPTDGLYFGEQSFLDWREQTYPEWTADDVVHIAMGKALSTNLLHLRAIEVASALAAETGDSANASRFGGFADSLRAAIRTRFWLEDEGLFSTYIATRLDSSAVRRYDLLGSAFAVLYGVADAAQATRVLSNYPHYGPGAPVVWPQQQQTPIYHNRGEWPFVTAYWLRAAAAADHDGVADRMVNALVRGAAINLSNMENFEAGSGAAFLEDGTASGPVVNSQRQLWSVAAYLSMVHDTLFGLHAGPDGLAVEPYLTRGLRNDLFAGSDSIVLNDYPYRGRTLTVALHLPAVGGDGGAYDVGSVRLNGRTVTGPIALADLDAENRVDVVLVDRGGRAPASLTDVPDADWRDIFSPRTPVITAVDAGVSLGIGTGGETPSTVTLNIYRDGARVASDLPGTTTTWSDPTPPASGHSPCYAVESCFASGNCSQHSAPQCWWGTSGSAIEFIDASGLTNTGGSGSTSHGRFHYEPWGDPGDRLELSSFVPSRTGTHLLQVLYGNGAGAISTGITCAIKRIVVEDGSSGAVVAEGPVVMPHLGDWARWEESSFVPADLEAGRSYRIIIRGDDDVVNMSSFSHFETYTGGLGGSGGTFNRVNIAELRILAGR